MGKIRIFLMLILVIWGLSFIALARDLFKPLIKEPSPRLDILVCANQNCVPEVRYNGVYLDEGENRGGIKLIKKEKRAIVLLINGVLCKIRVEEGI